MRKITVFIITILFSAGCDDHQSHMRSFDPQTIFTIEDAQLILGTRANGLQSSAAISPEGLASCEMKYDATSRDSATGKIASLVFAYTEFTSVEEAEKSYALFKKSDEHKTRMKTLNAVGDDAYFASDGSTYYYLLARKNSKTFQLRAYPITSATSLDEFHNAALRVVKRIGDSL